MKRIEQHKGKVILAGAGPGDPELLTLKVMRYLQKADVVITDRLVSSVILDEFVNKEAQVLHVGKQCRKGASTPQSTINELIVDYALQGKLVVRLKGGDVSIFSNVLDELQVLVANQIEYEIVPGVTAALGAAAYAGIPLTARDHATAVRFLTYYKMDVIKDEVWKDLAATDDTLVFYMSSDTTDLLIQKLIESKIGNDKHIAVIEQATTPLQNVYECNVYDYAEKFGKSSYVSPTLLIIGKVAALHQQFKWTGNSKSKENYFEPVAKAGKQLSRA
ncbi:MAG TPA: uroporphyrinogen-III C-methyltransferase [Puia sp.]|nr:uroporphyrinogen-III C-methyltransferase [Puia sp.]